MPERVIATTAALELIGRLRAQHGALLFHQSGGCCEGTAPMCLRQSDFRVGAHDLLLGTIGGVPFYIGDATFQYFAGSQILVDVTRDGGDSFSIEAADGVRFVTRSRQFDEAELRELAAAGPPASGPEAFQATSCKRE